MVENIINVYRFLLLGNYKKFMNVFYWVGPIGPFPTADNQIVRMVKVRLKDGRHVCAVASLSRECFETNSKESTGCDIAII